MNKNKTLEFLQKFNTSLEQIFQKATKFNWFLFVGAILLSIEGIITDNLYILLSSLVVAFLVCPLTSIFQIPGLLRYSLSLILISWQFFWTK